MKTCSCHPHTCSTPLCERGLLGSSLVTHSRGPDTRPSATSGMQSAAAIWSNFHEREEPLETRLQINKAWRWKDTNLVLWWKESFLNHHVALNYRSLCLPWKKRKDNYDFFIAQFWHKVAIANYKVIIVWYKVLIASYSHNCDKKKVAIAIYNHNCMI